MPSADAAAKTTHTPPPKPFSLSLSSSRPPSTKPSLSNHPNQKKRPYSALADADSDPEDDPHGRHEAVVGFGLDGKAISVADRTGDKNDLLVIKPEKSGPDWREETRRRRRRGGKNLLPTEAQQVGENGGKGEVERVEVSTVGGLRVGEKRVDGEGDTHMGDDGQVEVGGKKRELTADEEAAAALLGEGKKSTLVIPATRAESVGENGVDDDDDEDDFVNEADRFRADVESRPLAASLADYDACPVDGFGAAILRGHGWKDGEGVGKGAKAASSAPREVKRRPALLGLGAKETPGGVSEGELGAWNQKKGRGKEKVSYNPVMMRNSKTGEMVTEEEFELRKLEAKQGRKDKEADWRERRDRNLMVDDGRQRERLAIQNGDGRADSGVSGRDRDDRDRRKDGDRRRDRDDGYSRRDRSRSRERGKEKSSRRERDRSKERQHEHERRRKDDDYDRRYRDTGSSRRDEDRGYDRRARDKDYDHREHARKQKRH